MTAANLKDLLKRFQPQVAIGLLVLVFVLIPRSRGFLLTAALGAVVVWAWLKYGSPFK